MTHRSRTLRPVVAALVFAGGGLAGPVAARAAGPARASSPAPAAEVERAGLPVLQVQAYRMAGRIRPLLFWIGRDNVGSGLIVWRGGEGAAAYELLIGTDPATAPRGINRWGYIMEEVRRADARVFGVMTTSEEATLSDVTRKKAPGQAGGRFKAIDARIEAGSVRSTTGTIETDRDLTLHEVSELVRRVQVRLAEVAPRDAAVPPGVRPGFLTAIAELMADTITAGRSGPAALRRLKGRTLAYVYGRNLLDLSLTGVEPSSPEDLPVHAGADAPLHASFEARSRVGGERYRFELDYGSAGPLAGVPLVIRYQPRWWLQVALTLDPERTRLASLERTGPLAAPFGEIVR